MRLVWLWLAALVLLCSSSIGTSSSSSSSSPSRVVVHVVPHSHDDCGWLKTIDQYYAGLRKRYDPASVELILTTVVDELVKDPARRFIQVEIAFFVRWWRQQPESVKQIVHELVDQDRFEFISGGYCMAEAGAAHYFDLIDSMTLGHQFIKETFGKVPTIGWSVDPFGHSLTEASLMTYEAGFDAIVLGRIDWADAAKRLNEKNMEFLWRASRAAGDSNEVFTIATPTGGYRAPIGLCVDITCIDDSWQDDPSLADYNIKERVQTFVDAAMEQAAHTNCGEDDDSTCNIMMLFGEDFHYTDAYQNYRNLDRMIKYINLDARVSARYSTPSTYVQAKHAESRLWTVTRNDMFPYSSSSYSMWSGYFTSRPTLKHYVRTSSSVLRSARQIEALALKDGSGTEALWEALSILQHHDAVAGTSKQHVAYDYAERLSKGIHSATTAANAALAHFVGIDKTTLLSCPLLNISVCITSTLSLPLIVVLWNPMPSGRRELIHLPWNTSDYQVTVSNGPIVLPNLIRPTLQTNALVNDSAPYELLFYTDLPPLGYQAVLIDQHVDTPSDNHKANFATDPRLDCFIQNPYWRIDVDRATGYIANITDTVTQKVYSFSQRFLTYFSGARGGQQDGAYVLQPNATEATPLPGIAVITSCVNQFVYYFVQEWSAAPDIKITQVVSIVEDKIELQWTVGPLPNDGIGRTIITRYETSIASNKQYWSDSNGREFVERIRDYRETWNLNVSLNPVAQNYVPATQSCGLNSSDAAMWILIDRAQGCASLQDGSLEFMLHRRLFTDDRKGLNEPLNETQGIDQFDRRLGTGLVVTGKHRLILSQGPSPASQAAILVRRGHDLMYMPPYLAVFSAPSSDTSQLQMSQSFLTRSLPSNLDLVTYQHLGNQTWLLRFAHTFGVGVDFHPILSRPVQLDLAKLFSGFELSSIKEVSLTTNQAPISFQRKRYVWSDNEPLKPNVDNISSFLDDNQNTASASYTFTAQQIRTFIVTASPASTSQRLQIQSYRA